jgi:hypothetical protein
VGVVDVDRPGLDARPHLDPWVDAVHAGATVAEAHRQVRDAEDLRAAAVRARDSVDARARGAAELDLAATAAHRCRTR